MALLQYTCPKCGGGLEYESTAKKVKCPYCDTEFGVEVFDALDKALDETAKDKVSFENETTQGYSDSESGELKTYVCQSCGAEIVTDVTTAASTCPYCDNPIVMTGNLKGDLKPELIIPFKLNKEAAMEGFKNHMTGKKLLPKAFMEHNHLQEVKGIYVPFWLYDSTVDASVTYHGTISRVYDDGDEEVTETDHYSLFRAGELSFKDIPVDGSKKLKDDLMESIEPYDLNEAVPFKTAYMAGYYADKYDITSENCYPRVLERMTNSSAQEFLKTVVGFGGVMTENAHVDVKKGRARYGLLPVWILTTRWEDQLYTFAMNGQTGKFVGNLPCDKSLKNKIFFQTFGIGFVLAAAVQIIHALFFTF